MSDFNRGLEQGIDLGTLKERERIIKLLEDDAISWSPDCSAPIEKDHCQSCWNYADLIARIKGEGE